MKNKNLNFNQLFIKICTVLVSADSNDPCLTWTNIETVICKICLHSRYLVQAVQENNKTESILKAWILLQDFRMPNLVDEYKTIFLGNRDKPWNSSKAISLYWSFL